MPGFKNMEKIYNLKELVELYPSVEIIVKDWISKYMDSNHPDVYYNTHELVKRLPDVTILGNGNVFIRYYDQYKTGLYVNNATIDTCIISFLMTECRIMLSLKPIKVEANHLQPRCAKWKIYENNDVVKKGIYNYNLHEEILWSIFFPNAFKIVSEQLNKE